MKIYGIPNCDTVKKSLTWLKAHHVDFDFHDFKKHGISESKLKEWSNEVGWEALINKRGTTWKKLDQQVQASVIDAPSAFAIMQEKPSMIKRPVIESPKGLILGYDEEKYRQLFL